MSGGRRRRRGCDGQPRYCPSQRQIDQKDAAPRSDAIQGQLTPCGRLVNQCVSKLSGTRISYVPANGDGIGDFLGWPFSLELSVLFSLDAASYAKKTNAASKVRWRSSDVRGFRASIIVFNALVSSVWRQLVACLLAVTR